MRGNEGRPAPRRRRDVWGLPSSLAIFGHLLSIIRTWRGLHSHQKSHRDSCEASNHERPPRRECTRRAILHCSTLTA